MTLRTEDFPAFFAALNHGHRPFAWQQRLLDGLAATGVWPDVIAAPTGSGKSNVVDVHVFANALHACGAAPRLPRRLAVVVDRRALVDNQVLRAKRIQQQLATSEDEAVREVARLLRGLCTAGGSDLPVKEALVVAEVRGGLAPDSHWLDDPSACAVIGATPDMWGSRLLMRGYGSSPCARPREAGLLAYDSVMVLDEAHLNGQLLRTARRVGELTARFEADLGIPPLQVVETTATPDGVDWPARVVAVEEQDLGVSEDQELARRLRRPKTLSVVESPGWPSRTPAPDSHVMELADQADRLRKELGTDARAVGCIVNHVDTAVRVARELSGRHLKTACWVGRKRPMDIDALVHDHPDLFDSELAPTLDVLVATQTVEVGLDIDFGGMVTELAPGSSLAQRAGRVNRKGIADSARIVVVVPPSGAKIRDLPPYTGEDLQEARAWLATMAGPDGLSPWAVRGSPPPARSPQRMRYMRPEISDAWRWAATVEDSFEQESLSLWLRDDLDEERAEGGLVLRGPLPADDSVALGLLLATEPDQAETFPVTLSVLRGVVERVLAGESNDRARAFLFRPRAHELSMSELTSAKDLQPGDVVVLDAGHSLTEQGVVVPDPPARREDLDTRWGATGISAALEGIRLPDILQGWLAVLHDLAGLDPEAAQAEFDLRRAGEVQAEISLPTSASDLIELPWLVLTEIDRCNRDETVRQEWTVSSDPVRLVDHGQAVGRRASRIVQTLGLVAPYGEAVVTAARMHDMGKDDARFQGYIGRQGHEPALAKSTGRTPQQIRRGKRAMGLPAGWRHEHRSVLHAATMLEEDADRDLVVRLVGTSHGYGRSTVPQSGADLLCAGDPSQWASLAEELFDRGGWAETVGSTDRSLGVWACAFLEALVRAADCQVSREGA